MLSLGLLSHFGPRFDVLSFTRYARAEAVNRRRPSPMQQALGCSSQFCALLYLYLGFLIT